MTTRSTVRVRYAETDNMGVVYHTNFLVYFEVGRTDYFRQFGWTYRQMEADDVFMPVTECCCRYFVPARYDDELEIVTRLEMLSRLKIKFHYEVFRKGEPKLIAEGYTIHVPVNSGGKPCKIPAYYQEALKQGERTVS